LHGAAAAPAAAPRNTAILLLAALACLAGCAYTVAKPDVETFDVPRRDAITFWGHACSYIDIDGFGIVTDPVFDTKTWGRTRTIGAPRRGAYAGARLILISHAHDDHLSPTTIRTFPDSVTVLCPAPSASVASEARKRVKVMKPGEVYVFPGGRIHAVAAHHPGARRGVDAEADGRALGYVIESRHGTIYYSGDTDLFDGFAEVGSRYAPRITLLNVNGHLIGDQAVAAAIATRSPIIVPMHFGAYGFYFWGGYKRPRSEDELKRGLGPKLLVLDLGASLPLAPGDSSSVSR
jgi:L-ascorbate metabolism protein UlaG (beta-lactamase superfamily)